MADLAAIIRATRASASALARMSRHARAVADANAVIARTSALQAAGRVSAGAAFLSYRVASENAMRARKAFDRASRDYRRAQDALHGHPLPGDR